MQHPNFKDLTGMVFVRLTVLRRAENSQAGAARWLCRCSCDGTEKVIQSNKLLRGRTKSCGCLNRELKAKRVGPLSPTFKHGHSHRASGITPTYTSWAAMRDRCLNKHNIRFNRYGGNGIKICDDWLGEHGFEKFLADLGERPEGTTLGRFGDVGAYEPNNVKWMTSKEQVSNYRTDRNRRGKKKIAA